MFELIEIIILREKSELIVIIEMKKNNRND